MDILGMLRQEDDNPRGQQGGQFVSGKTLEEAAAAEATRAEIRSLRWSIGRQEEGILHIVMAKNFFRRMRVAEPRLGRDDEIIWTVRDGESSCSGARCTLGESVGVSSVGCRHPRTALLHDCHRHVSNTRLPRASVSPHDGSTPLGPR